MITGSVGGLKDKWKNKLALHLQYSLMNAVNVEERLEQQSSCYSTFVPRTTSNRDAPELDKGILPMPKGKESIIEGVEGNPTKQVVVDPALANIKCYRCQEYGHKSNTCPKQREIHICEGSTNARDDYVSDSDSVADNEVYPDEGQHLSCLVH